MSRLVLVPGNGLQARRLDGKNVRGAVCDVKECGSGGHFRTTHFVTWGRYSGRFEMFVPPLFLGWIGGEGANILGGKANDEVWNMWSGIHGC